MDGQAGHELPCAHIPYCPFSLVTFFVPFHVIKNVLILSEYQHSVISVSAICPLNLLNIGITYDQRNLGAVCTKAAGLMLVYYKRSFHLKR